MTEVPTRSPLPEALDFLDAHIRAPYRRKRAIYDRIGCPEWGGVADADWIALAALLTGDEGAGRDSLSQLIRHHVQAIPAGGSAIYTFVQEYADVEYGLWSSVDHLVFIRDRDLSRITLRRFSGAQFAERMEELGGENFLWNSRFTDPDVEFTTQWLDRNAAVMLIIEDREVRSFDSRLWKAAV